MPIFRYTFKKILISPSTWVIFVLTLLILGLTWGIIGSTTSQLMPNGWTKDSAVLLFVPLWKMLVFGSFVALMLMIFIGVKATQIFRDEIDDGTLLILVSKPISRNRIWAEKWLSFQVTIVLFIFANIFFASLILIIPGIGDTVLFLTLIPYFAILFGISLLFELLFTSIILLLTLVLNSKATIAIAVGFAALINIFSQGVDKLITAPTDYFHLSHAAAVYHDVEKKVNSSDFTWFKEQIKLNDPETYKNTIKEIIKEVYSKEEIDINYPISYNPAKEQEAVHAIINKSSSVKGSYSSDQIILLTHINNISNVFRQWKEQAYESLMTGVHIPSNIWSTNNSVEYSTLDVITGLNTTLNQAAVDKYKSKITNKRIMRYFNVFYQIYYLWDGAWKGSNSLYISEFEYESQDDPYLISFVEKEDGKGYKVDANSGTSKIIIFPVLVTFYSILGLGLLITSWYVFNRRDFA